MLPATAVRQSLSTQKKELLTRLGIRLQAMASTGQLSEEDQATVTHEEFIATARNRLDHEKLQALNAALRRLETGEYGRCGECGEPIAPKRLRAIPWARFCLHCEELRSHQGAYDAEAVPAEAVLSE